MHSYCTVPDPGEPVAGSGTYSTLTVQSQTPVNQWLGGELIAVLTAQSQTPSQPVSAWGTYCTLTAQSQTPGEPVLFCSRSIGSGEMARCLIAAVEFSGFKLQSVGRCRRVDRQWAVIAAGCWCVIAAGCWCGCPGGRLLVPRLLWLDHAASGLLWWVRVHRRCDVVWYCGVVWWCWCCWATGMVVLVWCGVVVFVWLGYWYVGVVWCDMAWRGVLVCWQCGVVVRCDGACVVVCRCGVVWLV